MPDTPARVIPIDAIDAIRTLPHITVDQMAGLWVSLDAAATLLDSWAAVPPGTDEMVTEAYSEVVRLVRAGLNKNHPHMDRALRNLDAIARLAEEPHDA